MIKQALEKKNRRYRMGKLIATCMHSVTILRNRLDSVSNGYRQSHRPWTHRPVVGAEIQKRCKLRKRWVRAVILWYSWVQTIYRMILWFRLNVVPCGYLSNFFGVFVLVSIRTLFLNYTFRIHLSLLTTNCKRSILVQGIEEGLH